MKFIDAIINFFNPDHKEKILKGLLDVKSNQEMIKELTTLQNEISVGYSTKVVAITSINKDDLASAFAKAFAEVYSYNHSKTLIIDANLYNPCLKGLLKDNSNSAKADDQELVFIDDNTSALILNKEIYPSEVFKSGCIQKAIKDNKDKYDHFIILVPNIKDHKEIVLLKDVITASILITQKNITKKEKIFDAISFFKENNLPLAKTVLLK